MAPRTLASTWKQYDKVIRKLAATPPPHPDEIEAVNAITRRVNRSRIVGALATLFVHPYPTMEEMGVRFYVPPEGEDFPDWAVSFDPEEGVFQINPVAVFRFRDRCRQAAELLTRPEGRADFADYRYNAYLAELRKLPDPMFLFLLLLGEVANARKISQVEKKGGQIELAEDEAYTNLLWAFKELETFYATTHGADLRAEYGILWYESEWFVGR